MTTLAGLSEAAEQQRLRTLTGLGPKVEENVLKALKERSKPKAPARPLLGPGLPAVLAVVEALRAHPAAEQVSEAGSVRRRRETFRDLDIIATATDAAGADRRVHRRSTGWPRSSAKGGTKATVISHDGLPLRPPGRAAGVLREPAPALHRLEGPQRGDARGGAAARALDLRVRHRRGRVGRGAHVPHRGGAVRVARLPVHPARAAREQPASWRRHGAASCRRSSRRAICAATCTPTRPGRRTARARWRRWRSRRRRAATPTWRSPTTRTTCATGGWRRRPRSSRR